MIKRTVPTDQPSSFRLCHNDCQREFPVTASAPCLYHAFVRIWRKRDSNIKGYNAPEYQQCQGASQPETFPSEQLNILESQSARDSLPVAPYDLNVLNVRSLTHITATPWFTFGLFFDWNIFGRIRKNSYFCSRIEGIRLISRLTGVSYGIIQKVNKTKKMIKRTVPTDPN